VGDVSARSALTIHRGTAHPSPIARPVLVLGVDAPGAGHAALHDLMVTRAFSQTLPASVRRHLVCREVDRLVPVTQKHDIEGLVLGVDESGSMLPQTASESTSTVGEPPKVAPRP
jgi:hypothetical protein